LARAGNAPLAAVLAWVPPGGDFAERRAPSPHLREIWWRAASEQLRGALDAAWGDMPTDLSVQRIIARGEAGQALVDIADSPDDLLVVGAGQRGALTRLWHGKVSRYCLRHAICPVLAIPPSSLARHSGALRRWSLQRGRLDALAAQRENSRSSLNG
jgi:nucleotide-binding universal stress UspA family protein